MMGELLHVFPLAWHLLPSGAQLAILIFISYTLIAINTCAIAKAKYLPTFFSSVVFMVANFFLIQHVAEAKSLHEFYGYLVGGVCGDLMGIYISKKWNIV